MTLQTDPTATENWWASKHQPADFRLMHYGATLILKSVANDSHI